MTIWALPEHIEDVLPRDACKLERMRRAALDCLHSCGYELVVPPLLEYVDSLLSGTGRDMDLATFKLVDQLSGRTMGVRADTTPQVARIDAHVLNRQGISRLCYAGSVLHTLPDGLGKSRQPFQVGAELYGHAGLEADIEIQQLMIDVLAAVGVRAVQLDMGHPQIFRCLIEQASVTPALGEALFAAVGAKDIPALEQLTAGLGTHAAALRLLPLLYGDASVLDRATALLPRLPSIDAALNQLRVVGEHFSRQGIPVSVDLGELGGFNYESGIVFAAFASGAADAVARGGRYDDIGRAFGRARAATGFSADLKSLLPIVAEIETRGGILAPVVEDAMLRAEIESLRHAGERVVRDLPGHDANRAELGCDRELVLVNGHWTIRALTLG